MHEKKGLETYQVRKNLIKLEKNPWGRGLERKVSAWEMNSHGKIEKDRETEVRIAYEPIYRTLVNLEK